MTRRPHDHVPTLGQAVALFVDEMVTEGLSRQTRVDKERTLEFLIRVAGGERRVNLLTRQHFVDTKALLQTGLSDEENAERIANGFGARKARSHITTRGDIATLNQFVHLLRLGGWVAPAFDPLAEIVRSSKVNPDEALSHKTRGTKQSVPEGRWDELLDKAEAHHARTRIEVAIGLYTGRRVSDVVLLTWGQFDLDSHTYWYWNAKGGKRQEFSFGQELHAELVKWQGWVEERHGPVQPEWPVVPAKLHAGNKSWLPSDEKCRAMRGDTWLWPIDPTKRALKVTLLSDVKLALAGMGFGDLTGEGTHTLRRSHGRVVKAKHGLEAARHSLGHVKAATTEQYLDMTAERQAVSDLFRGKKLFETKPLGVQVANVVQVDFAARRRAV